MTTADILLKNYNKYPLMTVVDFVKLIYQNEFGCGHFIKDPQQSLNRIKNEIHLSSKEDGVYFENIGNGFSRLYLSKNIENQLKAEYINNIFVSSAIKTGDLTHLQEKLSEFLNLCQNKDIAIPLNEAKAYLEDYKRNGFPLVSHSEIYHKNYNPTYRVVKYEYEFFIEVILKINSLLKEKEKVIIAIDGRCASGKSTLANLLSTVFDSEIIKMDDFFLPMAKRNAKRLNEAGGNVDYERFYEEVVVPYLKNQPINYRVFSCQKGEFDGTKSISQKRLTIVEGSYSQHKYFKDPYDLKIFVTADYEKRLQRISNRNGEFMLKNFINRWIPLEENYFFHEKTAENCDIIFNTTEL